MILSLSVVSSVIGFWQIPKLAVASTKPVELERLMSSFSIVGVYLFAVFGCIVGCLNMQDSKSVMVTVTNLLLIVQVGVYLKLG